MANIECFLAQARSAGRLCEARTLEENLRQLQDEWDRMQEEETRKKPEAYSFEVGSGKPEAYSFEVRSGKPEAYSFEVGSEKPEAYSFEEVSVEEKRSRRKPEPYQASPFNGVSQTRGCLNPFEEETVGPNPFEERSRRSPRACLSGEKSEGPNPFEEVVVVGEAPGNPFEEQEGSPGGGGNPFEVDEEEIEEEEIEEELLRQQIDNIKAYVFDAKQAGRLDEVASLMDNLAELRQALDGAQKRRRAL
ncbi:rabenosyn-5 [Chiloscyllium plagiosum]|uniref:rabenosyn-5 n=1 Tax=Chiloscyllium plagiosum TaxID=36176 RepID=UPI001CB861D0|nr:rabenosyn-5 [Chiloscyllium plagiosum]